MFLNSNPCRKTQPKVAFLNPETPYYLKNRSRSLGIRILPHLEKSKLNLNLVDDVPSLDIVPWKLSVPVVRLDLTNLKKDITNPEIYKQFYLQVISESFIIFSFFFSPTVLKQRKELLRRLYPLNELINLLPVGFQTTVQYIQQS